MASNVVIGQSGGPTAVINQSLVGCVETLRENGQFGQILGARHGVRGIVADEFIDLTELDANTLEGLAKTPSAALGSSRDKPDREYCERIFSAFARHDVRCFFYIGGNDSSDTCRIVNELARESGYELQAIHIPKTIDNDLVHSDHTPGYASAARFVACAFAGDNLDNKALPGIKIDVVMGRHAGFLTAASTLARQRDDDGPHLVYLPEKALNVDKLLADVDAVYSKYGRCLVAVSEGVHNAEGTPLASLLAREVEQDAHGNVQLSGTGALGDHIAQAIKSGLAPRHGKLRVRADTFGYLQRSFLGVYSDVDAREAREVGRQAAKAALDGRGEASVAIERVNDAPYEAGYRLLSLTDVAAKTRVMPHELIHEAHDVTDAFRAYAAPLVGELPPMAQL